MLISICIPAYEMYGSGFNLLDFNLSKIYAQTYKNIEVVVSDQANDYSVMLACSKWADKLNIRYVRSTERGSSSNINSAMRHASGEYIKIIFQDDFLFNDVSIQQTVNAITPDTKWLISACKHTSNGVDFVRPFYPRWNDDIPRGINTISSPSVLTIKNNDLIFFDVELLNLMDTDYYYRLKLKYGMPTILNIITVVNRSHSASVSNTLVDNLLMTKELKYTQNKYSQ